MKAVLEGVLFLVGDEGITKKELVNILDCDNIDDLINEYIKDCKSIDRGIELKQFGDKYKLTTKAEHKEFYEKLSEISDIKNLSVSALETLAIVAYNEPVTRAEVDSLRGVYTGPMIRKLVANDFLKVVGRSDLPGKPILYATTDEFLDYFGINSIKDLPQISFEKEEIEDMSLYDSKYKEEL